jgi:hypothetical protein
MQQSGRLFNVPALGNGRSSLELGNDAELASAKAAWFEGTFERLSLEAQTL